MLLCGVNEGRVEVGFGHPVRMIRGSPEYENTSNHRPMLLSTCGVNSARMLLTYRAIQRDSGDFSTGWHGRSYDPTTTHVVLF